MTQTSIWWIRRDIRLHDNPALRTALENADRLISLFIVEPELMEHAAPNHCAFLLHALADLNRWLQELGSRLILHHPTEILKDDGDPYVVYTTYKNKWYRQPIPTPADCLLAPQPVRDFPGTAREAQDRLTNFTTSAIHKYKSRRDRLDLDGTSRLSPCLRFGLISAREAFAQSQIAFLKAGDDQERVEIRTWMDELVWREFYTAILYHFPHVMEEPFRADYQDVPWRDTPQDLHAWQQGQTGFPIVDARMRQLLETGWMHNRGRMIAASFLTKDLLINWQHGEAWFMDNLIDGDPTANNSGWQWSAGTGTDAAPYFRIFNLVLLLLIGFFLVLPIVLLVAVL